VYIEQEDFREDPPSKFFRLAPGREVRLRYAFIIKCVAVIKDPNTGEILELRCTFDPETRSGLPQAGRKVKSTIHWVSAAHALEAEVRLYESLFTETNPGGAKDLASSINPNSLEVLSESRVEPSLAGREAGARIQFERQGYFCVDPDTTKEKLVFNRTVPLRDTWAKLEKGKKK
jgi:glutaminyl-tRNA synthetase